MIRFLLKGILHDSSRSLLPIIVVSIGVMVTVVLFCWINGIMGDSIKMNANFTNGHVKVMTRAYATQAEQMPNDLAILEVNKLVRELRSQNPGMDWVKRIRFGALADFPDSTGETRAQGPVAGWAIDLFSPGSLEIERFNIRESIVSGHIPMQPSEALLSDDLATKFEIKPGDNFTLFGTTMDGSMAFKNFIVSGTVRFGAAAIDRGAIITDITDAQTALSMDDAASEVLGYFNKGKYDDARAQQISTAFNEKYKTSKDEFAPEMITLKNQEGMAQLIDTVNVLSGFLIFVFVLAMSVVLWNAGLLGSLRRFNEFGVRLALGEDKNHIYKTLIYEGVLIGFIGTVIGTIFGIAISYFMQEHGLYIGNMMRNSSLMMPAVARAEITPAAYFIGIIPGLISMVLGNALAGIGIYKRKTASLFKELEV
jgi:putative ABC transport system permease protein